METNHRPLTPISFLQRSARVFPDRIAVVDHGTRLTYREFHERARSMAAGLSANGVNPGDRVAFLANNGEPLLTAHSGVPMSGAVLVAINPRLARDEIIYILKDAEAAALVADPALLTNLGELQAKCPEMRRIIALGTAQPGFTADLSYTDLLACGAGREVAFQVEDEDALISLNYTSGTTGYLKGVMYTHRGAYLNALGNAIEVELTSATRYLWTLPMFHCNGWCYSWAVTAVGGTHICLERPVPAEVFRLVETETITHLCAAPTVLIDLAQYASSNQIALAAQLTIMTGGAAPAPQVIQNMEAIGAKVIHLYGLTETYGPSTFCQWHPEWSASGYEEQVALKARQGVADLMVEQRVVRDDMTDVEPDGREIGEIVIRGNAIMKGYYRDPSATQHAFRGGWFHSGDLAVIHPDGYVEVKDRAKDVIISGGENVSTLEVERVIYTHPAVLEVAVVSSPHERFGEVPKAFVVLKPNAALTAETLHTYCRERLAGFKCPSRIDFVKELPKTSTGKIQKYILREREWRNRPENVKPKERNMALRTVEQYKTSLHDGRVVYFRGKRVQDVTTHPVIGVAVNHAAIDYEIAHQPEYRGLAVYVDQATGEEYSRYFKIPVNAEDLLKRSELIEISTRLGRTLVVLIKEIGTDCLLALHLVARQMDQKLGTGYSPRVRAIYEHCRNNDLAMAVAQTDVKGDRSRGPAEQNHPDYYVRVVDRRDAGIVVRGAKVHTSVTPNANELFVIPTRNLTAADADYAVAFCIPLNTPGLKQIASPYGAGHDNRFTHPLSSRHKMMETLTVFDDVFVPNQRVFMNGEWQFAGTLAKTFVEFHRFTAISYKLPLLDLLAGSALLIAQQNGIERAGHVREKLTWLISYAETVRMLTRMAAMQYTVEDGIAVPNTAAVNIAKLHFASNYHQALMHVQDLTGGLLVTGPGEEDLENPETGKYIDHYLGGAGVTARERLGTINLISDLTTGEFGGYQAVLAIHAEGSLEAEKLTILREYDQERVKSYARWVTKPGV